MTNLALLALTHLSLLAGGPTYAEAYNASVETGSPLVVLVGADWCPGCQAMKGSVIPSVRRNGGLDGAEFVVVDTDAEGPLARRLMRGTSIPQLIMFYRTADGWKRTSLTGRQSEEAVASFVRRGVEAVAASPAPSEAPAAQVSQTGR